MPFLSTVAALFLMQAWPTVTEAGECDVCITCRILCAALPDPAAEVLLAESLAEA